MAFKAYLLAFSTPKDQHVKHDLLRMRSCTEHFLMSDKDLRLSGIVAYSNVSMPVSDSLVQSKRWSCDKLRQE